MYQSIVINLFSLLSLNTSSADLSQNSPGLLKKPDEERNTIVLVQFNDEPGTVMVFRVINKLNMLSLRGMAAAKVSRYIQKIEAIENIDALDVPKDVVPDIRRVFSEDLKVSTYSRYLYEKTCCVGCAALHIANHW